MVRCMRKLRGELEEVDKYDELEVELEAELYEV